MRSSERRGTVAHRLNDHSLGVHLLVGGVENLLLHSARSDEPNHNHLILLPDAVCAGLGLSVHSHDTHTHTYAHIRQYRFAGVAKVETMYSGRSCVQSP